MSIRSILRSAAAKGFATAGSAPIRIETTNNKVRVIPAGSGSTEVELADNAITSVTAATLTITGLNRTFVLNVSTGSTLTLPAATGSGAQYELFVGTALASGSYKLQVANAADYMRGVCWETQDGGDTSLSLDTADTGTVATESDTITFDGSTQGGVVGSHILVRDIASHVWYVEIQNKATGTEVTPFSAAV